MSVFASVERLPEDPILGLTETYRVDTRPQKVNLGVGVYSDDQGHLPVMAAVRRVEEALLRSAATHHYLPIDGLPQYVSTTQKLVFGEDSPLLAGGRVATAQTLGGSGALRVGGDLLKAVLGEQARMAISRPSWSNHHALFGAAGIELLDYRYYDAPTRGLDFSGMLEDLGQLRPGTVVLLHACCHNPTGVDLSASQWKQVAALLRERQLLPFVDMAYQGFDRGIADDTVALQALSESGIDHFLLANSYSKNFSLYGERVGALSVVAADRQEADRLRSQLKHTIRANYSSPPIYGARLVAGVLGSVELRALWEQELGQMRTRIHEMRRALVAKLVVLGAPDFSFIERQSGMFSYSGLSPEQVDRLRQEHAIYALSSGRICMAALTTANLDYVAQAIATVTR